MLHIKIDLLEKPEGAEWGYFKVDAFPFEFFRFCIENNSVQLDHCCYFQTDKESFTSDIDSDSYQVIRKKLVTTLKKEGYPHCK